ncbi:hypothetical protein KUTeg_021880 [Tegillarca granosa]|uniref:B box-type domain-containing protein n=1 Tax=Tegillarca granosa TaxID=220873 RepID=A0ABQ9E7J5_TEGGR|nr:hypothetical protein KUTeg_021880 [Tegillarca granosa]
MDHYKTIMGGQPAKPVEVKVEVPVPVRVPVPVIVHNCDLCGQEKVKNKCNDCDQWLCDRCKNVHGKISSTKNHNLEVIEEDLAHKDEEETKETVNQDGSQVEGQTETKNEHKPKGKTKVYKVNCDIHKKDKLQMYCTECKCPVCLTCVTASHLGHKFVKIKDISPLKRQELSEYISRLKQLKLVEDLMDSIQTLQRNEDGYSSKIAGLIKEVRERSEQLVADVTKIRDALVSELQSREKETIENLQLLEEETHIKLADLRKVIKTSEEKLGEDNDVDFISFMTETEKKMANHKHDTLDFHLHPVTFVPTESNLKVIEKQFGELIGVQEPEEIKMAKTIDTISTFEHKEPVSHIAPISDTMAWIGRYFPLTLVGMDGHQERTIQTNVHGIAITQKKEVLISGLQEINKLAHGGKVVNFVNTSPYFPHGLFVTAHDEVMACLTQAYKDAKVVKMNPQGMNIMTIQYDKDGKPIYKEPRYVVHHEDGDVWVSDVGIKCVVVTNKHGRIRFKYKGPQNVNIKMRHEFKPHGLAITKSGTILVNDHKNSTVHLVDKNGQFIQFFLTRLHGIDKPTAIAIDTTGNIWISCWNCKVHIFQAMTDEKGAKKRLVHKVQPMPTSSPGESEIKLSPKPSPRPSPRPESIIAESVKAESLVVESVKSESLFDESIRALSNTAASIRAESVKAESTKAESIRAASIAESQRAESLRAEILRAESRRAESLKAESLRAESLKTGSIKAGSVKDAPNRSPSEPMKVPSIKTSDSLKMGATADDLKHHL